MLGAYTNLLDKAMNFCAALVSSGLSSSVRFGDPWYRYSVVQGSVITSCLASSLTSLCRVHVSKKCVSVSMARHIEVRPPSSVIHTDCFVLFLCFHASLVYNVIVTIVICSYVIIVAI